MIENIFLAVSATLIASLVVYAFRVRQLYVVLPRLFSVSALTSTGKLVELRVFNRGRTTEEDVVIALSPGRRYEIIASTDVSPTLSQNTLVVPRVPPKDDFSVLLMVEGGEFAKAQVATISSKTTKGSVVDGLDHVPPNAGNIVLAFAAFIFAASAPIIGMDRYSDWERSTEKSARDARLNALQFVQAKGWSGLEKYSESHFRTNYGSGEFPIHQKSMTRRGALVVVTFTVINKAAAELTFTIQVQSPYEKEDPAPWDHQTAYSHSVPAGGVYEFDANIYWPRKAQGRAQASFDLLVGNEGYIPLIKQISVD